jgi:hypothetical protein
LSFTFSVLLLKLWTRSESLVELPAAAATAFLAMSVMSPFGPSDGFAASAALLPPRLRE